MDTAPKISVDVSFEEIRLPPFQDILILGRTCPHGKKGIAQCFNLMDQDKFSLVETETEVAQGYLVSSRILKKISKDKLTSLLQEKVYPFITSGEVVKVDLRVIIKHSNVEIETE